MTRWLGHELTLALLLILGATLGYAWAARGGIPPPGGLLGHALGIVGFVLMCCTETLYTLRKRVRGFTAGSMRTWLSLHILTGLVGPYLVLLHSGGRFNGLAGVVTVLMVVMVLSGFVGRYLYTATPRTLDGAEVGMQQLEERIAAIDQELHTAGSAGAGVPPLPAVLPPGWLTVLARGLLQRRYRRRVRRALRGLARADRALAARVERLLAERYRLLLQVHSLLATRRLLALWHLFHLPLGAVLFTLAFLYIGAALYYSTFLK